jgi:hypothetical protein
MDMSGFWFILGNAKTNMASLPNFTRELALSNYVVNTYPKLAIDNLNKFHNIVLAGDYSSADKIEHTVMKKVKTLKPSVELFSDAYCINAENLINKSFCEMQFNVFTKVTKGNTPHVTLARSKLVRTLDGAMVVPVLPYVLTLGLISPAQTIVSIINIFSPMIDITTKDIYSMISDTEKYLNIMSNSTKLFNSELNKIEINCDKIGDILKEASASNGDKKALIKELLQMEKAFLKCVFNPYEDGLSRMSRIVRAMYYFVVYSIKRFDV